MAGASALRGFASSSSAASLFSARPTDDDGMVFLPRASPLVAALCVVLYVALALVALARMLSIASASSRLRADALQRQRTFQRLLFVFALVRAASFLPPGGLARGLLNRLALCVFFSLVLFQVLFWIDIANAKVSTRSRRIWNAFVVANALFYAAVLGLCVFRWRETAVLEAARRPDTELLERARLWDLLPVLLIALGSLAASLGLLYSTCKTRRRVGRVLRQFADQKLPKRLNDRVEAKLERALRLTNVIMGVCSVLFLLRTVLYLQRPFSQTQCGTIRDANACVLIGYGLPELVPCSLFLVLMWEVEPHLELPSRRKSSVNAVAVARATETTPLLLRDRRPGPLAISVDTARLQPAPVGLRTQRPSPLSLALGGNVIASARRRLRRVLEDSFGMRAEDDERSSASVSMQRVQSARSESPMSRSSSGRHDSCVQLSPPAAAAADGCGSRSRESSGVALDTSATSSGGGGVFVWMSFQCFHLKLPSASDAAVVLVLHEVETESSEPLNEFGRTEIASSSDPYFHVMLPVQVNESRTLRASVYAVTRPKTLQDLNTQWLIGSTMVPLAAYQSPQGLQVPAGAASVHELQSPLSRTHSSGELVVRCEAPLLHGASVVDTERLERIARAFVYQPTTATVASGTDPQSPKAAARSSHCCKLLVEEELIESVYTWEIPYQLLQLILSDLLVQLDVLKRALLEPSDELCVDALSGNRTVSSTLPTRPSNSPSVGMLSEMIMQIQGDAMERKSKKWGEELVTKMEKYIDDVEAAILRYESANHGGLTFKPSTMKADSGLSFLALNLHQQLVSVGCAVTASTKDLQGDDCEEPCGRGEAEHYVHLVDSSKMGTTSRTSARILETEDALFQESASEDEGEEEGAGEQAALHARGGGAAERLRGHDRSEATDAPEPMEALRRRVISFDSAETIVNSHVAGGPLSREQRQLAASIVALGVENALDEAEQEPDAVLSPVARHRQRQQQRSHTSFEMAARETLHALSGVKSTAQASASEPFANYELYGTTTVGAFAAHVYGFRKGGVRQLRSRLSKVSEHMAREASRAGSELTVEALEREYVELKWLLDRRLEVAFSQAMSALATCFQQTLYVHLHSGSSLGLAYLEQLAAVGFVFSVESLLSTYSKEAGMLGDMEAAVRELEKVQIKLRPVQSPRAAQFRVSVTSGPRGLMMELPLIVVPPEQFATRTMHRVLGQDASTGAVYVSLATPEQWTRARRVFRRSIAVVPVIFSQGMNEMQTVANTVGKDTLQREINNENLAVLERYVDAWSAWRRRQMPPLEDTETLVPRVRHWTLQLKDHVARADRGKHMDILTLSSAVGRAVGGGRVTCCKSAKDRTSMAVTLEEASLLVLHHGLHPNDRERVTALLRTHGVRRENARKNIGQAQYCFSALQNYLLPADYQCPPGTGGGARTLS